MDRSNDNTKPRIELVVNLVGLIKIFGEALYKEFTALVRELVQNGHDAIIKKHSASNDFLSNFSRDRVTVIYDEANRILIVSDTGIGMTKDELAAELNNFAGSQKKQFQEDIIYNFDSNLRIIGEYGVGFLSAMAASTEVNVWSLKQGSSPAHWKYNRGDATALVEDIDLIDVNEIIAKWKLPSSNSGTIIICEVSEETYEAYPIDEYEVKRSLVRYATLLPIPVYFKQELISCKFNIWDNCANASLTDWKDFIEKFTNEKTLYIIPLYSPSSELDIQGVLWIPESLAFHNHSPIDVYIKRMFVTKDESILKPEWARFMKGVINSNNIRRIVAGNTIIEDKHVLEVKDFIKEKILTSFQQTNSQFQKEYNKIFGIHYELIKEAAISEQAFLSCIWDKVRFKAGYKLITIPEYLSITANKIGKKI